MPQSASIYLVDGDPSSRRLLAAELGRRGFETWPFDSEVRFLAVLDMLPPSCILLAIDGEGGIDLIARLSERSGGWPIIAIDHEADVARAVAAMRAGAADYLELAGDYAALERAVRTACGSLHQMLESAGERQQALARLARLTPREKEVATALLSGLSNKRAAHQLGISVRTIEMHRSNVMAKLGVRNMAEAAVLLAGVGFGEADGQMDGADRVERDGAGRRRLTFAA